MICITKKFNESLHPQKISNFYHTVDQDYQANQCHPVLLCRHHYIEISVVLVHSLEKQVIVQLYPIHVILVI